MKVAVSCYTVPYYLVESFPEGGESKFLWSGFADFCQTAHIHIPGNRLNKMDSILM